MERRVVQQGLVGDRVALRAARRTVAMLARTEVVQVNIEPSLVSFNRSGANDLGRADYYHVVYGPLSASEQIAREVSPRDRLPGPGAGYQRENVLLAIGMGSPPLGPVLLVLGQECLVPGPRDEIRRMREPISRKNVIQPQLAL